MNRRLTLHQMLVDVLETDAVYFQPPTSIKMQYPCIVYSPGSVNFRKLMANGQMYILRKAYDVTVIDANPDSDLVDKMLLLPYCHWERRYTAQNLNHDVFRLYY